MKRHGQRLGYLLSSVTLAFALTAVAASPARSDQVFQWEAPAAWAITNDLNVQTGQDFDAKIDGLLESLLPREALVAQGGQTAWAAANVNQFAARAASGSPGQAMGKAFLDFIIHDPQARGLVKVILGSKPGSTDPGFSGAASAANDGASAADVSVLMYPWTGWSDITLDANNNIVTVTPPPVEDPDAVKLRARATVECYMAAPDPPADQPVPRCKWEKSVLLNNALVTDYGQGDGSGVSLQTLATVGLLPGLHYVIALSAFAAGSAMAVVDPVVEPSPDNPDIAIEFPNAVSDPNPQPLMAGITPASLQALGIDPQPFVDVGFLDPPSADTTPPTTAASATPPPNASGWNNSAVTVTLAAADDAVGSGVREIDYVLAGASTGSRAVPGGTATVPISAEGSTTVTYFAVDNAGNQEAPHTLTVRIDTTGPSLAGMPAPDCSLWPPNHKLVQVADVTASDSLSGLTGPPVVTVTSNEPDKMSRSDRSPDVVVSGGVVMVRAERSAKGTGRVYTITATASDLAGNTTNGTATCTVPHDHRHMARP